MLACEQALHSGDIVKSRRTRGDAKAGRVLARLAVDDFLCIELQYELTHSKVNNHHTRKKDPPVSSTGFLCSG